MDDEKSIALAAVGREVVNLENIPIEEVFENLKCTRKGLSSDEIEERLQLFGYNKLEEKKLFVILVVIGGFSRRQFLSSIGEIGADFCHLIPCITYHQIEGGEQIVAW